MSQNQKSTSESARIRKVYLGAILNSVIAIALIGVILCLLAGRFNYWQGWGFAVLFAVLTNAQGVWLGIKDPKLLERRKMVAAVQQSRGEKITLFVAFFSIACLLIFSALDQRFGWSHAPFYISFIGDGLMVLSFIVYYVVFRVNSFAGSSIQTFEDQKVISSGPYAIVRHPKYVGDLFLLIGTPLSLGSWWALLFLMLAIPGLVWRILDEERLLKRDLPGYIEYTKKVRYRLIPYIW